MKKMMLFIVTTFASVAAFAQETAHASAGLVAIAAGLAIGLAVIGGTMAQGKAAAAALEGMARNPASSDKLFTPLMLALALIESRVILAVLVAFIKLPAGTFGF